MTADRDKPQPAVEPTHPPDEPAPEPPGWFVSPDLRADCTRFLEEVRRLVRRRVAGEG